jgi:hypothetical protein
MPDSMIRGKCPFGDCGRMILFHEDVKVKHPGVCPDCLRRYRVAKINASKKKATLTADQ